MCPGPDEPGDPVHTPQFIQDRALDARSTIGLELDPSRRIVRIDGVHESENTGADEIVQFHFVRQFGMKSLGGVSDQIAVVFHQEIAVVAVPGFVEQVPCLIDSEVFIDSYCACLH
jgi:hypothetical protein